VVAGILPSTNAILRCDVCDGAVSILISVARVLLCPARRDLLSLFPHALPIWAREPIAASWNVI
jgi:hypothetical protein